MNPKILKLNKTADQWVVVYTRSNFERRIDKSLKEQGILSYCPVITSRNKWADRVKTVEKPFFSSYLFVKASPVELTKVRYSPGVIDLVSNNGKPVVISDHEIEQIKMITKNYCDAQIVSLKSLNVGDRVKIKDGAFFNMEGLVNRIMGTKVLMVIEQLDFAVVVKVGLDQLSMSVAI
jgi:transcription antitermination factor NusG